jgi:SAM-dependent methyltransferase
MSESKRVDLHWGAVSGDYLRYRNGYPPSFFKLLHSWGVGLPGQRVLDLGTGTGALAVPFAARGAAVTGVDPSPEQIAAAQERARGEGLTIDFRVGTAETTGLADGSFDVVTASMCWGYFDQARVASEVRRLLAPGGSLAITSILWQAGKDGVARATDDLIEKHQPRYAHREPPREEGPLPWTAGAFRLKHNVIYVEELAFSRAQWRGRIRASKWIGAALDAEATAAFDREHALALEAWEEPLRIPHAIRIHLFEPLV